MSVCQVDFSKAFINWARGAGYALLDVNVFPKPFTKSNVRSINCICYRYNFNTLPIVQTYERLFRRSHGLSVGQLYRVCAIFSSDFERRSFHAKHLTDLPTLVKSS